MAKLLWTLPLVVTGQIAVPPGGPTWTTQSPMIPSFEWFVFDHGESNRTSPGLAVAGGAVFLSGITGHEDPHFQNWFQFEGHDHDHEEEEDHDDEEGGDLFLVKVAVNGTPAALWTYGNAATVAGLVGSDESLAMFGSYIGDDIFGFTNVTTPPTGFVAKVNAMDGGVAWATALMTGVSGATFDSMGNLAVVGTKCSVTCAAVPTSKCAAFFAVLKGDDGTSLWEQTLDDAVTLYDVAVYESMAYLVGQMKTDAVVLAMNLTAGTMVWNATVTGGMSAFVDVDSSGVYLTCTGSCLDVKGWPFGGLYGGGVAKIGLDGTPIWTADVPGATGMVATADSVYVAYVAADLTFGPASFEAWGGKDTYIAKLNANTGKGAWVLQAGGHGFEAAGHLALDSNGDLYLNGLTDSHPSFWEPMVVDDLDVHDDHDHEEDHGHNDTDIYHNETDHHDEDHHNETDHDHDHDHEDDHDHVGYDIFIVKLTTSMESLPPCKINAMTIAPGFCFVGNACYEDGEAHRNEDIADCLKCSSADSQATLSLEADHFIINGTCDHLDRRLEGGGAQEEKKSFFQTLLAWIVSALPFSFN